MYIIRETISIYRIEIIAALVLAFIFLFLLYVINHFRISSTLKKYKKLVNGANGDSIEDILLENLDEVKDVRKELKKIREFTNKVNEKVRLSIQKVGFIRYNAFNDMGSDLSFSIALLDDMNDGFVITNIYSRDESNFYAKPIINGESKYTLSVEEMQAIDRATKSSGIKKQEVKSS